MGKIVEVHIADLEKHGPEELERIILHNIENEGLTIKMSGTLRSVFDPPSIEKYHTVIPDGQGYDGEYFKKDI